jgi:hypothetical protein
MRGSTRLRGRVAPARETSSSPTSWSRRWSRRRSGPCSPSQIQPRLETGGVWLRRSATLWLAEIHDGAEAGVLAHPDDGDGGRQVPDDRAMTHVQVSDPLSVPRLELARKFADRVRHPHSNRPPDARLRMRRSRSRSRDSPEIGLPPADRSYSSRCNRCARRAANQPGHGAHDDVQ